MLSHYFELDAPPKWHVPVIFNSPHSGSELPASLLQTARLGARELRQSEDYLVDRLFSGCLDHGMPMLKALVSRAWVDLNREPFEFDARMFDQPLPGYMNGCSARVQAGFGTVPRLVGDGLEIYRGRISLQGAVARIEECYRPYHRALNTLLNQAHAATGIAMLVDCHSMPSSGTAKSAQQPDVVLGDRFGTSCGADLVDELANFFNQQGLRVSRNKPYAGGFITETHGLPQQGRHALQIEINRALYMLSLIHI